MEEEEGAVVVEVDGNSADGKEAEYMTRWASSRTRLQLRWTAAAVG